MNSLFSTQPAGVDRSRPAPLLLAEWICPRMAIKKR